MNAHSSTDKLKRENRRKPIQTGKPRENRDTHHLTTGKLTIQDTLWSEQTGLPETYSEEDVLDKTEAVFVHVFRAYPTVPSPYYASMAS